MIRHWLFLLKKRYELPYVISRFYNEISTQFGKKIKVIRSDNALEYMQSSIASFCVDRGIIHQTSCVRSSQQDGVAERRLRHVLDVARTLMFHMQIADKPSIYVLDTPGVLVPSMPDIETGLKLALAGSVKDLVVGEERVAQYLLAVMNSQGSPFLWKHLYNRRMEGLLIESDEKHEYNLKDLLPKRKPLDRSGDSGVRYIEGVWWLDLGRLTMGFGVGIHTYVASVYVAEITRSHLRKFEEDLQQLTCSCYVLVYP
ncbi:uncharacterized protein LOC131303652 [Rhododendron vialii]|uniref:uncharacterized protein LOC131303652 n=1 Tax=Rhododendron vialii TaxID=182163 RepID=UPI00265E27A6|nr:uncharacterized protein LOC131303652 [Rhododendron vialii]